MRVVLAVVWLMVLCLPVSAAETVQRFNTNGDGQADQIIHYDGGPHRPRAAKPRRGRQAARLDGVQGRRARQQRL